jgi:hypothetical protein
VSLAFLEAGASLIVTYLQDQEFDKLNSGAGSSAARLAGQKVDVTDEQACSSPKLHSRCPSSLCPETAALPVRSNHCVWLHDQKRTRPLRPHPAQQNPEQSVGTAQVRPSSPAFQNHQLFPTLFWRPTPPPKTTASGQNLFNPGLVGSSTTPESHPRVSQGQVPLQTIF